MSKLSTMYGSENDEETKYDMQIWKQWVKLSMWCECEHDTL